MGIYTDYGRFQKAREFKNYCNSGAGIWFAFCMGSPRWDYLVTKELLDSSTDIPNVPPSSPAAFTPLYRWFASYKKGEDISPEDLTPELLQPQEMSLLDRSYAIPSVTDTQGKIWPDNSTVEIEAKQDIPDTTLSPSISTLQDTLLSSQSKNLEPSDIDTNLWDLDPSNRNTDLYTSPFIPAFPTTYTKDWTDIITKAQQELVSSTDKLYLFYKSGVQHELNDSWDEPNDSTKFESWAYMYHLSQTRTDSTGTNPNESPTQRPLGLYSFIQGQARFVEPIDETEAGSSNIAAFKYGSHYWRIVSEENIQSDHLPHHILLTVSVFPNELSDSSIVENKLPVRQVSVFKFPDCVLEQIPELIPAEGGTVNRRYQVLKRDRFRLLCGNEPYPTVPKPSKSSPTATENTPKWDTSEGKRQVYLPFNCDNPLDPNPESETPDSTDVDLRGSIEMLINDFMTARVKDVQQTDRYGYIIGF